uniref:RNA-directed DNA polymerase, eukaryota n=1 Tax=Tanacetum cinerariifolium TaxID=118510 RepID=A0A6L2MS57_TANCI|nr:RNA-directed DNA polymerase, eukaryota [Tanacetum cinerariifolium]
MSYRSILLRDAHVDYGPTSFRFFHYWLEMEGFAKMVEDGWRDSSCDRSNALRNLTGKLKHLKNNVRVWNKTKNNSNRDAKAQLKLELEVVDLCIDNGNGTVEDIKRRGELVNKLQDIDKLHALEMAQKAKVKWAVEGDENSSFFHGIINKKRNLLNIRGVMSDGAWVDNPIKVKKEFRDHFSKRFCKPGLRNVNIQMTFSNQISVDQKRDLEGEVTNDEIKKAVWDCGTDKAPVGVLGDIVSEVQSAFIMGRQILDGPFILNEVLQWCKIKRKQALIFKVDFEKAYDSVRWVFLDEVLNKFGFGEKWCKWIQACLKSSRGSVIINGLFQGLQLGGSVNLSHMFFADDAVFVGQWSEESCKLITVGRKLALSSLGAEQQQYNDLEDMVTAMILASMSDRLVWSLESSGEFTVASVRKLIDDKWLPGPTTKLDGSNMCLSRLTCMLGRRGISIDSLSCVMCDNGVETSNHLFFSCCFVRQVFRLIMRWWDVPEAEFESYAGWLDWFDVNKWALNKGLRCGSND